MEDTKNGGTFRVRPNLHGSIVSGIAEALRLDDENPRHLYAAEHLLTKFSDPDPSLATERRKAAIEKLLAVEERNLRTNIRLMVGQGDVDTGEGEESILVGTGTMSSTLEYARKLIRGVIGVTAPTSRLTGSFSGGASTSKRRGPGTVARKYSEMIDVTPLAWNTVWPQIYGAELWCALNEDLLWPHPVNGNVLFTVPKSDTIDRCACKEPDLNMFAQKAAGDFIRKRLKARAKVDLNDQSINQRLASVAWGGGLATVDLSSASDSVSIMLVRRLVSADWFDYLDSVRSHEGAIDGIPHSYEMFSSMGNGFTFELESLIFWALGRAVMRYKCGKRGPVEPFNVYGDDIIIHKRYFGALRRVLGYCGFKVNTKKSHANGPIRESCGKHYHRGVDVTPFFIKEPISNISELIHVLNAIRSWSTANDRVVPENVLADVWCRFARQVPKYLHGGFDCTSVETLASPKGPSMRLIPKKVKSERYPEGEYLHWLSNAERVRADAPQRVLIGLHVLEVMKAVGTFARTESATESSEELEDVFRVTWPQPPRGRTCPEFQHELLGDRSPRLDLQKAERSRDEQEYAQAINKVARARAASKQTLTLKSYLLDPEMTYMCDTFSFVIKSTEAYTRLNDVERLAALNSLIEQISRPVLGDPGYDVWYEPESMQPT